MTRRSLFGLAMAIVALLALATPALAGGWALVTLDALPREVRAGASLQLGFTVLQHGKTPTNKNLNGDPLKPVLTASRQGGAAGTAPTADTSIRAEARQEGPAGHFVVDVIFPSDGVWDWQIALPTFYVQDSPSGSNAAIMAPLTVLPAAPAAAAQPAVAEQPAAAGAAQPATPAQLGIGPAALRWGAALVLLAALALALYSQRGARGRRRATGSR